MNSIMPVTLRRRSWWRRVGRGWIISALVIELVVVVVCASVLLVGERTHASFVALYLPRQPLLVASAGAALLALLLKHRTLFAVQVVVTLVVLFPVMGARVALARSAAPGDEVVKVATYNVYFGKLGRPKLLDELAAMPVDILVLQAAYDSLGARLLERFPGRHVHQEGELAIVSRFTILRVEVPPLLPGELKPMFVGYTLDTPGGPLRIFNVHPFSPRNALVDRDEEWTVDVARREAQVAAAVASSRQPGPPFLVAGDTNLPHLSVTFRRELGDLTDAFAQAGFGLGYTFPAKRPWMRIDRVLASPGLSFTDARVGPLGASDHRPLFVDVALHPPARAAK